LTTKEKSLLLSIQLVAAVMLATTGCDRAVGPVSQPPNVPSRTGQPISTPSMTAPSAACPVDAATLETAFKANAGLASAIVLGGGLINITCYQDYAVARTTPTNVDPALVLFVYEETTHTWTAVTAGTAVPCGQYVPAAAISHLPGCADQ
jgi:hypothetical protein